MWAVLVLASMAGVAGLVFQSWRPYLDLRRSAEACLAVADARRREPPATGFTAEWRLEKPAGHVVQKFEAKVVRLEPESFGFSLETDWGRAEGIYREDDLRFLAPARNLELHASGAVPLWEGAPAKKTPPSPASAAPPHPAAVLVWLRRQVRAQGAGRESIGGTPCRVVGVAPREKLARKWKGTVWIAEADALPRKIELVGPGGQWKSVLLFRDVRKAPSGGEAFELKPPDGVRVVEVPLEQVKRFFLVLPRFVEDVL